MDVHRRDLAHPARRQKAMQHRGITHAFDIGANAGQYGGWLRASGFSGYIVSLEPLPDAHERLADAAAGDPKWSTIQAAAGAATGQATINRANDSVTSSMLDPTNELTSRIPSAEIAERLEVEVTTVDAVWRQHGAPTASLLKIDVQGFEHQVLDGAVEAMQSVSLVEIEMGLTGLYDGGSSIYDLLPRLRDAGFSVISIDSGYVDRNTGQVLDIDMLVGR